MVLLCKQKALYVKCCIIANGVQDSQGDTLYTEDIKKIFTSFNNQDNFEIYHDELPLQEVSLLENYISTANESIGANVVPAGSWNAVVRVDNPEIQNGLLTGEFGGVSLNNRIAPRCKGNLTGTVRYKDVADAECVIPLLISFVERGANGYPLHVMDYDAYIKKSKDVEFKEENGGKIMDFKEFLNGLKSLIKEAEAPVEPAIEKEDEATEDEVTEEAVEEVVEAVEEVAESVEEEPVVVEKEETAAVEDEADSEPAQEESEAEPEIEKADETEPASEEDEAETEAPSLEDRVANLEELVAKLTASDDEVVEEEEVVETIEEESEPVDEDTPKITKSEKVIVEDTHIVEQRNYYEMSGRDPRTGKKIRK